jgi:hypothetical protein
MTTNADQARSDWRSLLRTHTEDPRARYILQSIIERVVIDIIVNKMAVDDNFAEVIGRRITRMIEATAEAELGR